ncbi:MAG: hypothetical protein L0387_28915 [Acidobacteria bacterium]|nr:hypothetical protein [Acidobacteriota bacterium]
MSITQIEKLIYTAKAHTIGGHEGFDVRAKDLVLTHILRGSFLAQKSPWPSQFSVNRTPSGVFRKQTLFYNQPKSSDSKMARMENRGGPSMILTTQQPIDRWFPRIR